MGKIPTYKAERFLASSYLSKPRTKYYINPIVMPDYCKLIIKRLAVHYSGDALVEKLIELKFCSLKNCIGGVV